MTTITKDQQRENRAAWTAALRSGRFNQGRGTLHRDLVGRDQRFCCLGVACVLAVEAGVGLRVGSFVGSKTTYDGQVASLPIAAMKWLGLRDDSGRYGDSSLAGQNDSGETFAQIADLIDAEPKGLLA